MKQGFQIPAIMDVDEEKAPQEQKVLFAQLKEFPNLESLLHHPLFIPLRNILLNKMDLPVNLLLDTVRGQLLCCKLCTSICHGQLQDQ